MWKEVVMFCGGAIVGIATMYGGYRVYRYCTNPKVGSDLKDEEFAKKLREKEEKNRKFSELVSNQTYVELLTSQVLTAWFKDNYAQFDKTARMMIVMPTPEHMGGLGYPVSNDLDVNSNVVQLIFDESESNTINVLKSRLVNFTDIESNLQAYLIEQDGMIIVAA